MKNNRKKRVYATADRNKEIFTDYIVRGLTLEELGAKHDVTKQRIWAIIRGKRDETNTELYIALHQEAKRRRKKNNKYPNMSILGVWAD